MNLRPSQLIDFLETNNFLLNDDVFSHITCRYSDIVCYQDTHRIIETFAAHEAVEYEIIAAEYIIECMDAILAEALKLDRFSSDLHVQFAIALDEGVLYPSIICISDDLPNSHLWGDTLPDNNFVFN